VPVPVEMPPKKDGPKKGADLTPEEKLAAMEQTLEGEKNNLVSSRVPTAAAASQRSVALLAPNVENAVAPSARVPKFGFRHES